VVAALPKPLETDVWIYRTDVLALALGNGAPPSRDTLPRYELMAQDLSLLQVEQHAAQQAFGVFAAGVDAQRGPDLDRAATLMYVAMQSGQRLPALNRLPHPVASARLALTNSGPVTLRAFRCARRAKGSEPAHPNSITRETDNASGRIHRKEGPD
jgi:hypothetical protein